MFKQMRVVFLKELKCIFRDKKTFIIGLLVPLLLLPGILFITDFAMKNSQKVENIRIGISSKENCFYSFMNAQKGIEIVDVDDVNKALNTGQIFCYVDIYEDADQRMLDRQDYLKDFYKKEDNSVNSVMTSNIFFTYVNFFQENLSSELTGENVASNAEELNKRLSKDITDEVQNYIDEQTKSIDLSSIYFNMLVPLMLIMYSCVGTFGTAAELSAGEKERGTLEALLSTGADRTAIIMGKLLATTVLGMLTGICATFGLWGYLKISSNKDVQISAVETLTLLVITLFTAMLFAAINLTIGVYSKSYKEAQTYFTPVIVISLVPTLFAYNMDLANISLPYLSVPILNVVCIIKEVFGSAVNFAHLGIVLGWMIVYIAIALFMMQRLFKKEDVLFRL